MVVWRFGDHPRFGLAWVAAFSSLLGPSRGVPGPAETHTLRRTLHKLRRRLCADQFWTQDSPVVQEDAEDLDDWSLAIG
jgi:hypothetical protein